MIRIADMGEFTITPGLAPSMITPGLTPSGRFLTVRHFRHKPSCQMMFVDDIHLDDVVEWAVKHLHECEPEYDW